MENMWHITMVRYKRSWPKYIAITSSHITTFWHQNWSNFLLILVKFLTNSFVAIFIVEILTKSSKCWNINAQFSHKCHPCQWETRSIHWSKFWPILILDQLGCQTYSDILVDELVEKLIKFGQNFNQPTLLLKKKWIEDDSRKSEIYHWYGAPYICH